MSGMDKQLRIAFWFTLIGVATLSLALFAILGRAGASIATSVRYGLLFQDALSVLSVLSFATAIVFEFRRFGTATVSHRIGTVVMVLLQSSLCLFAANVLHLGVTEYIGLIR